MENFREALKRLEKSKELKEWQKKHHHAALAHFFTLVTGENKHSPWDIGFYHAEEDKLTVFSMKEIIEVRPSLEVFKNEGEVPILDLENVKLTLKDGEQKLTEYLAEENFGGKILHGMAILQKLDGRNIWNISKFSSTLLVFNVKVNAENGEVISKEKESFMG